MQRRWLVAKAGMALPAASLVLSACAEQGSAPKQPKGETLPPTAVPSAPAAVPTVAPKLALPTEETVLATLRPGHPRLILVPDVLERVRQSVSADPLAKLYRDNVVTAGQRALSAEPSKRVLIGPRLLEVSRTVLERVYTLALLFKLDGEQKWLARAKQEIFAAASFTDWNPSHFLDVAEMSHALAIGYDWLYDALSESERASIKGALVEKGLRAAEEAYRSKAWWAEDRFNWNNVCNGGIAAAALAMADEEPELCRFLVARAVNGLPKALASYGPDGAWAEGPGYWGYATKYTVLAFAVVESALGTDFGLSTMPGLPETGTFRLQSAGPTRLFFNFADAGEGSGDEPSLFWLGRRFEKPLLAWGGRDAANGRATARDLIWFDTRGSKDELARVPLDATYKGDHLAFFRSAWTDQRAIYVGFKGGDNKANHSHLDLGTFVLDALGQRWALDLGPDDYDLPGYFDSPQSPASKRWTYYRLRTEGHNTLEIGGQNQDPKAEAPLTAFRTAVEGGYAIADLSAAYVGAGVKRAQRGIVLLQNRTRVLVQDEVEPAQPVDIVWGMHTKAEVALAGANGERAVLSIGGQRLEAQLLAPTGARFSVKSVTIPPPQKAAPGVKKLTVRLAAQAAPVRLAVLFGQPQGGVSGPTPSAAAQALKVTALDQWVKGWPGS